MWKKSTHLELGFAHLQNLTFSIQRCWKKYEWKESRWKECEEQGQSCGCSSFNTITSNHLHLIFSHTGTSAFNFQGCSWMISCSSQFLTSIVFPYVQHEVNNYILEAILSNSSQSEHQIYLSATFSFFIVKLRLCTLLNKRSTFFCFKQLTLFRMNALEWK